MFKTTHRNVNGFNLWPCIFPYRTTLIGCARIMRTITFGKKRAKGLSFTIIVVNRKCGAVEDVCSVHTCRHCMISCTQSLYICAQNVPLYTYRRKSWPDKQRILCYLLFLPPSLSKHCVLYLLYIKHTQNALSLLLFDYYMHFKPFTPWAGVKKIA